MSWWSGDKPRKTPQGRRRGQGKGAGVRAPVRPGQKTAKKRASSKHPSHSRRAAGKPRQASPRAQRNSEVARVKVDFFPFGLFSGQGGKKKRRPGKQRSLLARSLAGGLYWGTVAFIWLVVAVCGLVLFYSVTLPNPLIAGLEHSGRALKILATDGSLIAERGLVNNHVPLRQLPRSVRQAVIAIEDRRFYSHYGFDPLGVTRAMIANLKAGRLVQGGSTITQQLAKNLFLNSERTLARKLQEMGMALWLETKFEKNQILELYLNRVYFGHKAYGIDQAARRYFGKRARDLTLSEAAMLAGLLKAPSRMNPKRNYKAAKQRAEVVLNAMVAAGYITPLTAKTASLTPAVLGKRRLPIHSNYIADWIAELVPEYISDFSSDLIVQTTIDQTLQRHANTTIISLLKREGRRRAVSQGAMVVMGPGGAVRAIVGGKNYQMSQFNRALHGRRQAGSVFKPFVYLTALEAGYQPSSLITDRPAKFHDWRPKNYQNKYRGQIPLSTALAYSSNVAAVKLLGSVGLNNTIETARRFGLRGDYSKNLSLALGTTEQSLMDLTAAYAPFANGGRGVVPFVIQSIQTLKGKMLYQGGGMSLGQVASSAHVNQMNDMLRGVVDWGTGKRAKIVSYNTRHDYAGKTGTTQNFRDGWFVGYSAYYVAGVWVGNDNGRPMKKVTGGGLPALIWSRVMSRAHADLAPKAMIARGARPVERGGWRSVGMIKRIKPQFFEKVLD